MSEGAGDPFNQDQRKEHKSPPPPRPLFFRRFLPREVRRPPPTLSSRSRRGAQRPAAAPPPVRPRPVGPIRGPADEERDGRTGRAEATKSAERYWRLGDRRRLESRSLQ